MAAFMQRTKHLFAEDKGTLELQQNLAVEAAAPWP
jgi:hypothetical protein